MALNRLYDSFGGTKSKKVENERSINKEDALVATGNPASIENLPLITVSEETNVSVVKCGMTTLCLHEKDMFRVKANAIVSIETRYGSGAGALACEIKNRILDWSLKEKYLNEKQKLFSSGKPLILGDTPVSRGYGTGYNYVVHAVLPYSDISSVTPDQRKHLIIKTYNNILAVVDNRDITSIVMTLIGTGEVEKEIKCAAGAFVDSFIVFCNNRSTNTDKQLDVHLVLRTPKTRNIVHTLLKNYAAASTGRPPQQKMERKTRLIEESSTDELNKVSEEQKLQLAEQGRCISVLQKEKCQLNDALATAKLQLHDQVIISEKAQEYLTTSESLADELNKVSEEQKLQLEEQGKCISVLQKEKCQLNDALATAKLQLHDQVIIGEKAQEYLTTSESLADELNKVSEEQKLQLEEQGKCISVLQKEKSQLNDALATAKLQLHEQVIISEEAQEYISELEKRVNTAEDRFQAAEEGKIILQSEIDTYEETQSQLNRHNQGTSDSDMLGSIKATTQYFQSVTGSDMLGSITSKRNVQGATASGMFGSVTTIPNVQSATSSDMLGSRKVLSTSDSSEDEEDIQLDTFGIVIRCKKRRGGYSTLMLKAQNTDEALKWRYILSNNQQHRVTQKLESICRSVNLRMDSNVAEIECENNKPSIIEENVKKIVIQETIDLRVKKFRIDIEQCKKAKEVLIGNSPDFADQTVYIFMESCMCYLVSPAHVFEANIEVFQQTHDFFSTLLRSQATQRKSRQFIHA